MFEVHAKELKKANGKTMKANFRRIFESFSHWLEMGELKIGSE
jgi:hypothetical protein